MIGEFLKHAPIPVSIATRENVSVNRILAKAKMKRLIGMSGRNVRQLTETATSEQLSEHKNQQLTPIRQLPVCRAVLHTGFGSLGNNPFEKRIGKKSVI